jgi:nicotinate-nucleotide--dimethylbenzimidazole phosphoribosyltransferase
MPEILTESFCERCGTRYTFESATPRGPRLKGLKTLSLGLKNFVMSDDTSIDEAMAAARSETDREVTAQQLDAFHKTFNFCMSCRQYTCGNCWNEAEGRCLSCAPHLGHEVLPAPFPDLEARPAIDLGAASNGANGHEPEPPADAMAWPTSDLAKPETAGDVSAPLSWPEPPSTGGDEEIDLAARLEALSAGRATAAETAAEANGVPLAETEPAPEEVVTTEPVAAELRVDAPTPEPAEPPAAAATTVEPPASLEPPAVEPAASAPPVEMDDRAAAAAAQTAALLQRFRPGQSLDAALEEFEREQAGVASQPGAAVEAAAAAALQPAKPAEPEAEPVAAAPEPEPVAAAPEPEPVAAAPEPEPVAAAPDETARPQDIVEQPTWQIVAPEAEAPAQPMPPVVPPTPAAPGIPSASAEPQWPEQPQWPTAPPSETLPLLGRSAAAAGGLEALWAESAREVAAAPAAQIRGGVQPCVSCGLSLSATARFCRRCGTRQG